MQINLAVIDSSTWHREIEARRSTGVRYRRRLDADCVRAAVLDEVLVSRLAGSDFHGRRLLIDQPKVLYTIRKKARLADSRCSQRGGNNRQNVDGSRRHRQTPRLAALRRCILRGVSL